MELKYTFIVRMNWIRSQRVSVCTVDVVIGIIAVMGIKEVTAGANTLILLSSYCV